MPTKSFKFYSNLDLSCQHDNNLIHNNLIQIDCQSQYFFTQYNKLNEYKHVFNSLLLKHLLEQSSRNTNYSHSKMCEHSNKEHTNLHFHRFTQGFSNKKNLDYVFQSSQNFAINYSISKFYLLGKFWGCKNYKKVKRSWCDYNVLKSKL